MNKSDQARYPPLTVQLKDGRSVCVRLLRKEDAQALAEFYARIPRNFYRFYCPHPLDAEHAALKAAAADDPCFVCLVLESPGGQICGYAWYRWQNEQSRASTLGICVQPDMTGIGAGRALMERLLDIATHIGPPLVSLTVQKANTPAVALYRKMGFRVVREQVRPAFQEFPAEPEFYMERPVRPSPTASH